MSLGHPAERQPIGPDRLDRPLVDLRVSVTDRCNFRCRYCMPREVFGAEYRFVPRAEILTFEEIERLARVFVGLGVRKVRLTGGEPLLRRQLEDLVARLSALPGLDLALTTNGSLLADKAGALAAAGLGRLTVSLDSLDEEVFARLNDTDVPVAQVLAGIDAAAAVGLAPVKINAVVRRGFNEDSVLPLVERFRGTGHVLRFVEYMDVGNVNGWRPEEVVPVRELHARIAAAHPLEPIEAAYRGEVARRWRFADGGGEIGFIGSVTAPFCGDCTRARLSADGHLYTCLFAATGTDLRGPLRRGATDAELAATVAGVWARRADRYSELRSRSDAAGPRIEMSYIGG